MVTVRVWRKDVTAGIRCCSDRDVGVGASTQLRSRGAVMMSRSCAELFYSGLFLVEVVINVATAYVLPIAGQGSSVYMAAVFARAHSLV